MPIALQPPLIFVCFRVVWNVLASICDVFPPVQWDRRVFFATNKIKLTPIWMASVCGEVRQHLSFQLAAAASQTSPVWHRNRASL